MNQGKRFTEFVLIPSDKWQIGHTEYISRCTVNVIFVFWLPYLLDWEILERNRLMCTLFLLLSSYNGASFKLMESWEPEWVPVLTLKYLPHVHVRNAFPPSVLLSLRILPQQYSIKVTPFKIIFLWFPKANLFTRGKKINQIKVMNSFVINGA